MNSGQKIAVSLLVSVALFVGFVFSVYTSVFNQIETRFYEPELINRERVKLSKASDYANSYIQNLLDKTASYAATDVALSFLSQTPTEAEVTERVRLSGELFVELPALDGIRFLDKNGRNLHYSSYSADIVKQQGTTKVYKNYPDIAQIPGESDFSLVAIEETEKIPGYKLSYNKVKGLLNISVPVFDRFQIYRGNFVFYCKMSDLERRLIKEGFVSLGDSVNFFIREDGLSAGLVTGLPNVGATLFESPVLDAWTNKTEGPEKVLQGENNQVWMSLSDYSGEFLSFAGIYSGDFFELPETARILILVCVFITLFLIVFLLFSFKIDDMVMIRSRIKKIQFAFIAEYLENKEAVDWNQVSRQIEGRKEDLFRDVKKSLGRKGRKHENQVDALLNKSWDEILSAIGTRQNYENQIAMNRDTSAELKKMLEEVLSKSEIKVKTIAAPAAPASTEPKVEKKAGPVAAPIEPLDEVEEIEDIEAAETLDEVESLDEVEALEEISDAESVEELDEVEEIEEIGDAEEVLDAPAAEAVEELDDVEEVLAEVEEVTEAEELLEDAEPVEELDEVESLDEVEALEEISDAESVEELDEVESLDEVEALDAPAAEAATSIISTKQTDDSPYEIEALDDVEEIDAPAAEVEDAVEEVLDADDFLNDAEPEPSQDSNVSSAELDEIERLAEGSTIREVFFTEKNSSFSTEEEFATVENVFAEELHFGESYIKDIHFAQDSELEATVSFDLSDPEFGNDEELIPVEETRNFYSMAEFGANNNNVSDLISDEDAEKTIVEKNGVFSISENLTIPRTGLDKDFKKLVDAVLR
ncbi:MAG: hypothetical protein MJ185_04425 [Treponema sp.]|nr:hypothetical protein [Treponema sp.]